MKIDKISLLLSPKKQWRLYRKSREDKKMFFLEKTIFYKEIIEKINSQKKKHKKEMSF